MSERAPRQWILEEDITADATDAEHQQVLGEAPEDGFLLEASLVGVADITGAADNNRKIAIINKGADGSGTVEMASITFDTGIDALDFDELAMTLSEEEGALEVNAGDQIAVSSTAPGSGLAWPGGRVKAVFGRQEA